MLGLRRSGKRRRNRNQPRHPAEVHGKERDSKQLDRILDAAEQERYPAGSAPISGIPGARPQDTEDVERPHGGNREGNQNR